MTLMGWALVIGGVSRIVAPRVVSTVGGAMIDRPTVTRVAGAFWAGCVPRSVEKERRPPLRHHSIRSGGNLRVFENLAQTLVTVDAS